MPTFVLLWTDPAYSFRTYLNILSHSDTNPVTMKFQDDKELLTELNCVPTLNPPYRPAYASGCKTLLCSDNVTTALTSTIRYFWNIREIFSRKLVTPGNKWMNSFALDASGAHASGVPLRNTSELSTQKQYVRKAYTAQSTVSHFSP